MKTAAELEGGFQVYFAEMANCEYVGCYWALLYLLVTLPDICAALEGQPQGGTRYALWCQENFPNDPKMTRGDRYQMRCALLHEGTTLPWPGKNGLAADLTTQYSSFSFTDPRVTDSTPVHQTVSPDVTRGGLNVSVDVKVLANDTRQALRSWFARVEKDPPRNAIVERNLPRLAGVRPKTFTYTPPTPGGLPVLVVRNVTSST